MSTKLRENITTRYGEPEKEVYEEIIELVKKNGLSKSRAQYLLVERGLHHTQNPEPIIKTMVKEVPKIVYKDKVVYRDPPKVDKSTSRIQEHVRGDDQNAGQSASKGQAQNPGQGKPPSSPKTALGEKKSLQKNNGISGWAIAGGASIISLLLYFILK